MHGEHRAIRNPTTRIPRATGHPVYNREKRRTCTLLRKYTLFTVVLADQGPASVIVAAGLYTSASSLRAAPWRKEDAERDEVAPHTNAPANTENNGISNRYSYVRTDMCSRTRVPGSALVYVLGSPYVGIKAQRASSFPPSRFLDPRAAPLSLSLFARLLYTPPFIPFIADSSLPSLLSVSLALFL